jgi:hypothetical protein
MCCIDRNAILWTASVSRKEFENLQSCFPIQLERTEGVAHVAGRGAWSAGAEGTPAQSLDLQKAHLTCCDSVGWEESQAGSRLTYARVVGGADGEFEDRSKGEAVMAEDLEGLETRVGIV